jgi:hypothetical protein
MPGLYFTWDSGKRSHARDYEEELKEQEGLDEKTRLANSDYERAIERQKTSGALVK